MYSLKSVEMSKKWSMILKEAEEAFLEWIELIDKIIWTG
jgi:hypothetical protein